MNSDTEVGCEEWFTSPQERKISAKDSIGAGLEGFSTGINEKNGIFSYILMFNIFHNLKVKENPVFPHQNVE